MYGEDNPYSKKKITKGDWAVMYETLNKASIDSRNAMSILRGLLDRLGLMYSYCGENFHVIEKKEEK